MKEAKSRQYIYIAYNRHCTFTTEKYGLNILSAAATHIQLLGMREIKQKLTESMRSGTQKSNLPSHRLGVDVGL